MGLPFQLPSVEPNRWFGAPISFFLIGHVFWLGRMAGSGSGGLEEAKPPSEGGSGVFEAKGLEAIRRAPRSAPGLGVRRFFGAGTPPPPGSFRRLASVLGAPKTFFFFFFLKRSLWKLQGAAKRG